MNTIIAKIDIEDLGEAILNLLDTGKQKLFHYLKGIGYIDAYVDYENLIPVVYIAKIAHDGIYYPIGETARHELNDRIRGWYIGE